MSIGTKGENLIFLISTPRAGSTLLQQILGGHPQIHTLPEPWIALPTLYALYSRKINRNFNTEYSRYWARTAIKGFFQWLPNGEEDYLEGIGRMYAYLYDRAMEGSNKIFFLDKGPRYYLIIPELYKVFPKAKFIILLRNPLAVLCSLIEIVNKPDSGFIKEFKYDLLDGPRLLIEGTQLLDGQCHIMQYEKLLKDPDNEINVVCKKLGIDFSSDMLHYTVEEKYKNSLGYCDQEDTFKDGRIVENNIDRWVLLLQDPKAWRLARSYLDYLGKDIIEKMGYSYDELQKSLDEHDPGWFRLIGTHSLLRSIKSSEIIALRKRKKRNA